MIDAKTKRTILTAQRNEITEHIIYEKLSRTMKDSHNREILERISREEREHYELWKEYTQDDVEPDTFRIWKYYLISRALGITFGIKLMERGEEQAQAAYAVLSQSVPAAKTIAHDEEEHEKQLIDLLDEERPLWNSPGHFPD